MARLKTTNTPDLRSLLIPQHAIMLAVEQAILRGHKWSHATAEHIAVRIAGAITMDLIHAGQRLLETDISEMLQVSRAPVREALRILERERLVEFEARRGAVVTAPDADDLRNIYVVRGALYQIMLRELMDRRPADLDALFQRRMAGLSKAVDEASVDAYTLQSFLLNLEMTELCANGLIVDLLISISLRTLRYVRLGLAANPELLSGSLKTWRALQRAVQKRDVDAVLETAQRRIDTSRDSAVRAIAPAARPGRKVREPVPKGTPAAQA